jgi:hypothetical protein
MKKGSEDFKSLKFEEVEEVKEFSVGGVGVGALIITTVAVLVQVLMRI